MPFCFFEIEQRKTKVIYFLFLFLVLFYFFGILVIVFGTKITFNLTQHYRLFAGENPQLFYFNEIILYFCCALIFSGLHWGYSITHIRESTLGVLKAVEADPKDTYHSRFKNIVSEVSVAVGGRKFEAVVIPVFGMNAFSIDTFDGKAVIGVTEGLLSRLTRSQLEAVVAHEAAHIVANDSLIKTAAVSLFALYGAILETLKNSQRFFASSERRRGYPPALLVAYFLTWIIYWLSRLINMFISRQCEYRADAVAVRLVRDPLSLAQALYRIGRAWRGGGLGYDNLESIFIISPSENWLDESESFFANMFSTHPPLVKRINILNQLAHTDFSSLAKQTKPVTAAHTQISEPAVVEQPRWLIADGPNWLGPFTPAQLLTLENFNFDSFVRKQGIDKISLPRDNPELMELLRKEVKAGGALSCPHCKQGLVEVHYEGMFLQRCLICKGMLVEQNKIPRILVRQEQGFSPAVINQAGILEKTTEKYSALNHGKIKLRHELQCPRCKGQMLRNFYSPAYLIEVDRCYSCELIWFDRDELEILQFLVEKNAKD